MTLYAVERIDDAVDMTRSFLTPAEAGRWGRLIVVVAFLLGGSGGGGSGMASGMVNLPTTAGSLPESDLAHISVELPDISATALAVVVGAIAALIVLGLCIAAVGAIMEFVFVESLSTDEIHVRRYGRQYAGKGLRLFAFRLALGVLSLLVLGGVAVLLFGDVISGLLSGEVVVPGGSRLLVGALVLVPLGALVGLVGGLVNGFTTEFVVPIMLREERGVIAGWRRFWPTLTGQWKQYGAYVLIAFGLRIVTGIAGSIVTGIAAVVLAIPFLLVAIPVGFGIVGGGTIGIGAIILLGALLVVYLLALFLASAAVYVPIKTFHRHFALLVLGDTNDAFDVLGDRRSPLSE